MIWFIDLEALVGPVLMIIGGIITWFIKSSSEELRATREKLRSERRKIYADILDPHIRIFAGLKGLGVEEAEGKIKSYDYRKIAFDLNLIGSDGVVCANNNFMKYAYETEPNQQDPREIMRLLGKLLLEIRRSLGNKKTKLNEFDMLRAMIKDIDNIPPGVK